MIELLKLAIESAEWNRDCLPENTFTMQLIKTIQEQSELKEEEYGSDKWYEELSDVFISSSGCIRFEEFSPLLDFLKFLLNPEYVNLERIKKEIRKKLDIIKGRKYEIVDGVYRHVN